MLKILTGTDIYSIWGTYIIVNLTETDTEVEFVRKMDVGLVSEAVSGENTYGVVLMGQPIQENQVEAVEQALRETTEIPFTKAYHFANWGETLNIDVSIVDEEINFVSKLVENIETRDSFIKFKDKESAVFARQIAEGLQSHHVYDGGVIGKNLMLLSELYGEHLLEQRYDNLEQMGDKEELVLKSLNKNMKEYVQRKVEEANIQVLDSGVVVVSLFAEKHINELGRFFINSLSANGNRVIVMIGRQTRGDDMYRIRTSEGVSASQVAHKLNKGKGKERAATVFLPKGNEPVYNTIIRALNSANI